jgi:hypothetical protein
VLSLAPAICQRSAAKWPSTRPPPRRPDPWPRISAAAIELCRLRLWLYLLVDTPDGVTPDPLPNLEFRTIAANSLTDYVAGIEVQNTRAAGTGWYAGGESGTLCARIPVGGHGQVRDSRFDRAA